jgi:tRNA (cytidine/uridine-2'-O-)-methyltransferase
LVTKGREKLLHIVLVEPEIPQNTGNIARTCAVTGASLHLIRPLGFELTEKWVRRAGLDYWDKVRVREYENLDEFFSLHPEAEQSLWLATTKAPHSYAEVRYSPDSWLMFGKETAGLPEWLREKYRERCVRIPMLADVRCLNLSNSVAVLAYEALRQNGFPGLTGVGAMGGNATP